MEWVAAVDTFVLPHGVALLALLVVGTAPDAITAVPELLVLVGWDRHGCASWWRMCYWVCEWNRD